MVVVAFAYLISAYSLDDVEHTAAPSRTFDAIDAVTLRQGNSSLLRS